MMSMNLGFDIILYCICTGTALGLLYLALLWLTVKYLKKVKHKALFLASSAILRLGLFLFLAVKFAQQNPASFLWIVLGFIMIRLYVLFMIRSDNKK